MLPSDGNGCGGSDSNLPEASKRVRDDRSERVASPTGFELPESANPLDERGPDETE